MSRRRGILLVAIVALWRAGAAPTLAAQKLAADGTLHRVESEMWSGGKFGLPALRHTIQSPDGSSRSAWVTGTEDLAPDRDPSLQIDPLTGVPILVWARQEGSGFDIFLSSFVDQAWTSPRRILWDPADERAPQIQIGGALVHVIAHRDEAGVANWARISLDSRSLAPSYGPEALPTGGGVPLPPEGETGGSFPDPPEHARFFASALIRSGPLDPGRIVVWGVRDEPLPIDYRQVFLLPAEVRDADYAEVDSTEGVVCLSFRSGNRFHYSFHRGGAWSDLRIIELSDTLSESDARLQIQEMIRRQVGG